MSLELDGQPDVGGPTHLRTTVAQVPENIYRTVRMSAALKILALFLVAAAAAPPPTLEFNDINQLIKALEMPGVFMNDKFNEKPLKVRMSKWHVTDCGMPSDPVKINGTLMPDPLNINDEITGSFNVTPMVMVSSPLKTEVTIMKKGSYVLPPQSFYLPSGILPSWLVTGEYHGKAMLSSNGKALACRELTMSVVSS
uniref:MD-2-related lipid-recognition domain-containing protein n=1 Tax=Branchiostoma floridae TaxID=7739 RepID=C3ZAD1_BRAFL|eukprot:XP_002594513.1 hypothetical protein BRAFLDRAFT_87709 [Branchiostoma floridae]